MTTALLDQGSSELMPNVCISVESTPAVPAKGSEQEARRIARFNAVFQSHHHLKGKANLIQCDVKDGCIQLYGVLPSYYLKQLAQEALKVQCPQFPIENWIVVVGPDPLDEIRF